MQIGIVTDAFPPEVGGVQTFAHQYVTKLAQSPDVSHVSVLAFVSGENEERSDLSIQRVGDAQTPTKIFNGYKWITQQSFDVVHALTLYPSGAIAALCNRVSPDTSTYATVYGLDAMSLEDHPILGPVHRFLFNNLDEVLFFSDSTREKTHEAYGISFRSRRIYPGVPTFERAETDPLAEKDTLTDGFVVLTVARLVERKGISDLVAAVAGIDSVSLWIVGDGSQRVELEKQVPPAATERIRFFGEIDHDQLPYIYERADVFSLPSVYLKDEGDIEGLGLVFLEAQQFGLPVVGTRSGGIPEAFSDGESGFLVDERSPEQIQKKLVELRDNEERYQAFAEQARKFVAEQFSWESCIQNHLEAYKQ